MKRDKRITSERAKKRGLTKKRHAGERIEKKEEEEKSLTGEKERTKRRRREEEGLG